jgi:hypothetical protein
MENEYCNTQTMHMPRLLAAKTLEDKLFMMKSAQSNATMEN